MNKRGAAATILSFLVLLLGVIPAGAEESPPSSSNSAATTESKVETPTKESAKAETKAPTKEAKVETKAPERESKTPVGESAKAETKVPVKEPKTESKTETKVEASERESKPSCPPTKRATPTPTVSKSPTTPPPTSPQPPAEIEYSDWTDVSWDCEVQLVTRTRTRAETPYAWNGSSWVLDRANTRYSEEMTTRPMTSSELLDCGPPVSPNITS